jgi:hexosaminidase
VETDGAGVGAGIVFGIDKELVIDVPMSGVRADDQPVNVERHALTVTRDGIQVTGATPEGLFRGATTLLHLIAGSARAGSATLPGMSIADAPRFAWRGLSLDVVRTFHPLTTVTKVVDLLALYKMNVLHLHLTDSEGWRFPVPDYPDLTAISGTTARDNRPGGWYSQEEYAAILDYAAERFVTIVPEFDSPGHAASVLRAYPDLATDEMRAARESMQYLDPDNPGTWDLVHAVYAEMAGVHPGGRIHIGGDEAIAMSPVDFATYMSMALTLARSTGKGIVAWQETARAGFAPGDLMQWWISPHFIELVRRASATPGGGGFMAYLGEEERQAFFALILKAPGDLPSAVNQGAGIIVSRADVLYLDTSYPERSIDPAQDALRQDIGIPPTVYGNGTIQDAYAWDPANLDAALSFERIAGIEAAVWCERIRDDQELMLQLLPRLPGIAEKGWSDIRDWTDYQPRLAAQPHFWDAMGVPYFRSSVVW